MESGKATGKCGFCHAPILANDEAVECSECGTLQHRDCWSDYGGCVLPGCGGHDIPHVETTADGSGEPGTGGGQRKGLPKVLVAAGAILAVSIAVVIAAAGVKLLSTSDAPADSASAAPVATTKKKAKRKESADKHVVAIRRLMVRVHRLINAGDWINSQKYLSKRKLSAYSAQGDVAYAWQEAMASDDLVGTIIPSRLKVSRVSVQGRKAEFRLAVPRRDGRCYAGVTWAVRENGAWRFDPGSAGIPVRRRIGKQEMRNRAAEC